MANTLGPLLTEVRRALHLNQLELAELIGRSKRTVQRLEAGRSTFYGRERALLVRALYPKDPELAARVAASGGETLAAAGIVEAPSAPMVSRDAIDSVLCAAADVLDLSPRAVRPALLAALTRASDLGLSVEALAAGLPVAEATEPSKTDESGSRGV